MKILFRQCLRGSIYLLLSSFALPIHAQVSVSGLITDSSNMPIPGVNILLKNTTTGTTTNFEGRFKLEASPSDTLVVSYIGFKTQELAVREQVFFTINLTPEANTLAAVLINAGYYTVKDKERTGSISRITAKEIENQPVNNPLEAMQGRMAGVEVVQNSGVPGGGFEVKIRGQNSIMAGNEPLYIIDGVPYDSRTLGSGNSSGAIIPGGNISPLNAINPGIIESIEVLKDADATAIYGSRGANGVVLITTRKGKEGKTKFTINSSTGIASITRKMDLMNTEQYLEMRREAFANDGITEYPANAYDVNGTWDEDRYTDWQEALVGETANTSKLQASVSGGSKSTQFLISGMYQNETTVYPEDFNYDRITINSNIRHTSSSDRFQVTLNTGYTLEDNFLPGTDLSFSAIRLAPNAPELYDDEGALNWENSTWTNPLAQLEGKYRNKTKSLFSSAVISYKLMDNLELKVNSGYGYTNLQDNITSPHTVYDPAFGLDSENSTVILNGADKDYWIVEPQLHWNRTLSNGVFNILVGSTFQKQNQEKQTLAGLGFPSDRLIYNLSAATTLLVLNEDIIQYNSQSFFTRLNYAYKNKLFVNLTGRRDGSSRFSSGNKYGNFGAVGAAWLFSEDINLSWLSFGKLRGSYGVTGNDQIGDYQYLQTYTINDNFYDGNIGLNPARLNNPNFKWEKNKKMEIALELRFLNQRMAFSTAYYKNRSSNQLINYALPGTTGFTSIQANLDALVENSGWEIELNGAIIQNESFDWKASFNLSLPKNELLRFPGLENSTYTNRFVIGEPLSIAKLYNLKGVNPETGLFEFEDYNNDGTITAAEDRQYIADLTPKFFGGFSNSLSYKNWAMDVFFQFVKKDGYNQYRTSEPPGTMTNQPVSVLGRWQKPGDQAEMQRFTTGANSEAFLAHSQFSQSNAAISDASFIRLKSLALSYTLPLNKSNNTSCRISVQGQNLLTFTRFKGGDPEQMNGFLPPLRRITFGVQLHL
ncbi:TonB-linked SusC/RagA family outer membrane protein [Mesonia hippocampi]|uniref:TonB-linked SusC/RagA family outer membrane protein n=1 Tax=Mesonia hippocampi TaxID=1628250 RepID=A0A840ESS1_9FLAO|nr:SusC/RagA family TonB-linked outer membrane protein [Mesonia hippocampi]MBB4120010.1 TonB-linked SusC/RagA family outer membrane protein [Mesonia hippocampi]